MKFSGRWLYFFAFAIILCCPPVWSATTHADPLEQRGFTYENLLFHPEAHVDTTYQDNVLRTRQRPTDDFLIESRGGFDMLYKPLEKMSLDINYYFGWHDYAEDHARDYLSHDASGALTMHDLGAKGFNLAFTTLYRQTGNSDPLENEIVAFSRFHNLQNTCVAEYNYNRLIVRGTYLYGFTDYFSRRNSSSDFSLHTGIEDVEYSLLPKRLSLYQSFLFQRTLRWVDDSSDFDLGTVTVGAKGQYHKFTYNFGGGYSRANALHAKESNDGPALQGVLSYHPTTRLDFTVGASRRFAAGVITGASTDTSVFGSANIKLTRLGLLSFSGSRTVSDRTSGTVQTTLQAGANFQYRLTHYASAFAGFTRTDRSETPGKGGFVLDETRIGFSLRW